MTSVQDNSTGSTTTTTHSYDNNGNEFSVFRAGFQNSFTWDYENQLTLIHPNTGGNITLTYDRDGRRVQKQDSAGTSAFIWDAENVLEETNAFTGAIQAVYTQEPQLYGNLLSQARATYSSGPIHTSWYHFDGLGSVDRLSTTGASVTDNYLYKGFGIIQSSSGSTVNPFCFVGKLGYYYDTDYSHYFLRARYYDPVAGRFRSKDPVGFEGIETIRNIINQFNLYEYVVNNPIVFLDPSGLRIIRRRCRCNPVISYPPLQPPPPPSEPLVYSPPPGISARFGSNLVTCHIWICMNPVRRNGITVGNHMYILLEREPNKLYGYRAGPSYGKGMTPNCAKKLPDDVKKGYGQLISTEGPYDSSFVDHPDYKTSTIRPRDVRCRRQNVRAPSCEVLHQCFSEILRRIDRCCIPYEPVPITTVPSENGCNSNCAAYWLLANCLRGIFFGPVGFAPGFYKATPTCVRDPSKVNS